MVMTKHFQEERASRYAYIATTIGVGEIIHKHKQAFNKWGTEPCTVNITSTGVAIVTIDDKIVTMYILRIGEAKTLFDGMIPMVLEGIIKRNMRQGHCDKQNQNLVQFTNRLQINF